MAENAQKNFCLSELGRDPSQTKLLSRSSTWPRRSIPPWRPSTPWREHGRQTICSQRVLTGRKHELQRSEARGDGARFSCLVPPLAEIGDLVAIFYGGQTPFLLRSDAASLRPNTHWLIGDCCVHGWMDGDSLRKLEECSFMLR